MISLIIKILKTMSSRNKPKDVVCVLNPDQIYQMQHYGGIDTRDFVTPYEMNTLSMDIKMPEIKENSIYTFIPYQNKYIHLDEQSEDQIIIDRIAKIETILSYLGAKSCYTTSTSIRKIKRNSDRQGGGGVYTPEVDTSGRVKEHDEFVSDASEVIESKAKYPGKYTIDGYMRAKELAEQYKLDNDSVMQQLLEARNPIHPNGIEEKEYHIDVQSDLEQLKKASYDLKAKAKMVKLKLNGSYTSTDTYQENKRHTFDFVAEFSPLEVSEKDKASYKNKGNKKVWWYIAGAVVIIAGALLVALL